MLWIKRLPLPTNKGLRKLFADTDHILIKEGSVYEGRTRGETTVLSLTDSEDLKRFQELMEIIEPRKPHACMCNGDHAIELYRNGELQNTIGFHHGLSIRYHTWRSDAELAKAEQLMEFLWGKGLPKQANKKMEYKKEQETSTSQLRKWLDTAPLCFGKYIELGTAVFPLERIEKELDAETPDRNERIISLLRSFACTERAWKAYPSYETLPYLLLDRLNFKDIIVAYLASDRNYNIQKGLGRFVCCYESRKKRKGFLPYLATEVVDELQACFEKLNDEQGKKRVATLRKEKEQLS
jgi:hypothetical protein